MRTIIHVKQSAIKKNTKSGSEDPVFIVRTYKGALYGNEVILRDSQGNEVARLLSQWGGHAPLACGARAWIALAEGASAEIVAPKSGNSSRRAKKKSHSCSLSV